ncbi:MAG: CRISPR-associated ring nuclease Crn3/Csx3 [Candidatus Jordarchaeales archaeon]
MRKVLLEITLTTDVLTPQQLQLLLRRVSEALPVHLYGSAAVIISGRLPVWAFSAITHLLHPFAAVATFDPRLRGGVIVASHVPDLRVGDVIDVSDAEKVAITFP